MTTRICAYCGREIDSPPTDTYRAIDGWEAIDGQTDLRWRLLDNFACGSCVDERFGVFGDDEDEASPADFSSH